MTDPFTKYPITADSVYGCWLWQGAVNEHGYAIITRRGWREAYAHRRVYEDLVGPIVKDRYLDHLCRRRACVRPDHLEQVTHRENQRRKSWRRRVTAKTCKRGHDLFKHGRLTPEGGKLCLICAPLSGIF